MMTNTYPTVTQGERRAFRLTYVDFRPISTENLDLLLQSD